MEAGAGAEATQANGNLRLAAAIDRSALPALGFALLLVAPDLDVELGPRPLPLLARDDRRGDHGGARVRDRRRRRATRRRAALLDLARRSSRGRGFLALHALGHARRCFLEASNLGFQIATPVGLAIASGLCRGLGAPDRASGLDQPTGDAQGAATGLLALMTALGDRDDRRGRAARPASPRSSGRPGLITVLAVAGRSPVRVRRLPLRSAWRGHAGRSCRCAVATGVHPARPRPFLATAFARNWHASWWEWHLLILAAFAIVAWAARREWREERFSSLYGDRTVARRARARRSCSPTSPGSPRSARRRDPGEVTEMLNAYFEVAIPPVVREHDGVVNQLVGRCQLMATFLDAAGDRPDHAAARGPRRAGDPRPHGRARRRPPELAAVSDRREHRRRRGRRRRRRRRPQLHRDRRRRQHRLPARVRGGGRGDPRRRGPPSSGSAMPPCAALGALPVKGKREPLEAYVLTALPGEASSG